MPADPCRSEPTTVTRQSNRNRYPFHGMPSPVFRAPAGNAYNRRSIRHRVRALLARVRRILGV